MSVLFILLIHLLNGTQFLNVTTLSLSSAYLSPALVPAPVTLFPLQICMNLHNHED